MNLQIGTLIKGLMDSEIARIDAFKTHGKMISIRFTGLQSNVQDSRILSESDLLKLEILGQEGEFTFLGDPEKFLLFAEAERIRSSYLFDPLFAVNCSIVDALPHQVEAVYRVLLKMPRIRYLLADDTGAGKTIMTGLLLKEMLSRGLLRRILIITPGGLTKQWVEDELGLKFNLPFVLGDRSALKANSGFFHSHDRIVTSIDFISQEDVLNNLKSTSWDIVIVDEAHKLSAYDYTDKREVSRRYASVEAISKKTEHLLLLTATPHRGRRDTFKYLLQLLDPEIFSSETLIPKRVQELTKTGVNRFFIRRLKEEMKDWQNLPLYKKRFTKTVQYELNPQEKKLYDRVTQYLSKARQDAERDSNIHVSLALLVMQRRLTSSIFAIKNTLFNRHKILVDLIEEFRKNPDLFKKKEKFEEANLSEDAYDELGDEEKESFDSLLKDPRKFKLFTTAKDSEDLKKEANQVKELLDLAESIYNSGVPESKLQKLYDYLQEERSILENNEKLVLFTEHKDTLIYLKDKLENQGYSIVVIHGGMPVDQRRQAQVQFTNNAQILIATDAAGEGINLQICRLLFNWDIPWNPNRLEQRMGRIHRYGQKVDVFVLNFVARNTREGSVLETLLNKLELIREQLGSDRVFDVISEVLEEVGIGSLLHSKEDVKILLEEKLNLSTVEKITHEQTEEIGHTKTSFQFAKEIKEKSDERRLQPIFIRRFFERAVRALGGELLEIQENVLQFEKVPESLRIELKKQFNLTFDLKDTLLCFNKTVFLDYTAISRPGKLHYINPGNQLFEALIQTILSTYQEEMRKGTVVVSPNETKPYFAFLVKSEIKNQNLVVDQNLSLVSQLPGEETFEYTQSSKFLEYYPPSIFAKESEIPSPERKDNVEHWVIENITGNQLIETHSRIVEDCQARIDYIREAVDTIIFDLTSEINHLQSRVFLEPGIEEVIREKQRVVMEVEENKKERIRIFERMMDIAPGLPEIFGCAYVIPLSLLEYKNFYGIEKDPETEEIAMNFVMEWERKEGFKPEDVSKENLGFDIRSTSPEGIPRYIEVKGRSTTGAIIVSENEWNRLHQLGESSWLYIVSNCSTNPDLTRFKDPARNLVFEKKSKGVQYILREEFWRKA